MYRWALFVFAAGAFAQNVESWVSIYGSDANVCTIASPCRTFAGAVAQTNAGGRVRVLTAGDYSSSPGLSITKSLTIDGGGLASLAADAGGPAVYIGVSAAIVTLRNLTVEASSNSLAIDANLGNPGGLFFLPSTLNLENIQVRSTATQPGVGINGDSGTQINLKHVSVIGGTYGIDIALNSGQSSQMLVTLQDVTAKGAGNFGAYLYGCSGVVRNAVFDANGAGLSFQNSAGGALLIEHSEIAFNTGDGLAAGTNTTVRLSDTTITGNATGIDTSAGGAVISFRNNAIAGNGVDNAPALATSLR